MIGERNVKHAQRMVAFLLAASLCALSYPQLVSAETELIQEDQAPLAEPNNPLDQYKEMEQRRIIDIIVEGNNHVATDAILHRVPFHIGEHFNPLKTEPFIRTLYKDLKWFSTITIKGKYVGDDGIIIYIIVKEKIPLKEMTFEGNSIVTSKEIFEKIDIAEIPAIDEVELGVFTNIIRRLYAEKGYDGVNITASLKFDSEGRASAHFAFKEPKQSLVKRIFFKGNNHYTSKKLRSILITKEDWLLGFLDRSGTYHPEKLEADRHFLEQYYQSNGFLNAKVADIKMERDPKTREITLTYFIEEGDIYTISEVKASGNDILPDEFLLSLLPVRAGQPYSRELLGNAMQLLERIWGDRGYIYAHITPSVVPDPESKTVALSFQSEIGSPVVLKGVNIRGNHKTKDKVIRRQLGLVEGSLLTTSGMESAKERVEGLGYFEQRDGVNWKITRLGADKANLDLLVKEAKTGRAGFKAGIGGNPRDLSTPASGASVELEVADTNFLGSGMNLNAVGHLSKDEKSFLFSLTQPYLCDRPIFSKIDLYFKRYGYDEFKFTRPINENQRGGLLTFGYVTGFRNHPAFREMLLRGTVGVDSVRYAERPIASVSGASREEDAQANVYFQSILDRLFVPADFARLGLVLSQDFKNHPMHPSRGYAWFAQLQAALPSLDKRVAFAKADFDAHWYTPLIGERDLTFHLHGYLGFVKQIKDMCIPYRELFNIGGPATVRGFLFGQVGPQFVVGSPRPRSRRAAPDALGDSIGGQKAFVINAELIFPISPDFTMKGVLFYDGGTGWDNPYVNNIPAKFIRNNSFDYRHAVGFGFRILNPVPMRVDWGFKLDRRPGETAYEVHFGMLYEY